MNKNMKSINMGKYSLINIVAKGGMAELYLAHNHMSGDFKKLVAIKKILPHFSGDQEFLSLFKNEAKVLLKMEHKNIVTTIDFGTHEGQLYLVMEYIRGKNIQDLYLHLLRRREKLPLPIALLIAREIAQGLQYIHEFHDYSTNERFNIVHRDISPNNIMLSYSGQVKIVDFGIARSENQIELIQPGTIQGKYGYMSPEQALGHELDQRTDIFSLGIILWEMIANKKLIGGNPELFPPNKYANFKTPSFSEYKLKIPFQIERIVKKALEPLIQHRYQNITDMLKDLNLVINFLYPEISDRDLSAYLTKLFANDISYDQGLQQHYNIIEADSLKTELLKTSVTKTEGTALRNNVFKFRSQIRIKTSFTKNGVEL